MNLNLTLEIEAPPDRAVITSIDPGDGAGDRFAPTTVELTWGGPEDREVYEFDLARLGKVIDRGGTLRAGWVILEGPCLLDVGDLIPLRSEEPEDAL